MSIQQQEGKGLQMVTFFSSVWNLNQLDKEEVLVKGHSGTTKENKVEVKDNGYNI